MCGGLSRFSPPRPCLPPQAALPSPREKGLRLAAPGGMTHAALPWVAIVGTIPGVILSEAAFGGEVEESASPPPKQCKRTDPSAPLRCAQDDKYGTGCRFPCHCEEAKPTWQSPGATHRTAPQKQTSCWEIATALRPRNDREGVGRLLSVLCRRKYCNLRKPVV